MPTVDEPVSLSEHDPAWADRYRAEKRELIERLGTAAPEIEHIGSTAVPGLLAKPIVDLMLGVEVLEECEPLVNALVLCGYEDCGGVEGRRYLRKRAAQDFNVQIVEHGGRLWRDNLLLRDYLRADAAGTCDYADAKREAAEHAPMLLAYSELKSETIRRLLVSAERWRSEA